MSYLFISHSRWDRRSTGLIDILIADLRQRGVPIWLAPDSVEAGADFKDAIQMGLANASALIYLAGKRSKNAQGMKRELEIAQVRGLPVISGIILPEGADALPSLGQPALDFTADYAAALTGLLAWLPPSLRQHQMRLERSSPLPPSPRSKGYIFISYAEEDSAFVDQLRDFLKARGYGYWDYRESDRNYHTSLHLELEEVIRGASATISVLSPAWKQSRWAAKEFLFSEQIGTPVFLVMAQSMEPTLVTAGIPYIDFTLEAEQGYTRLDHELRRKGLI